MQTILRLLLVQFFNSSLVIKIDDQPIKKAVLVLVHHLPVLSYHQATE
jgi:hypothetical protein